MKTGHPQVAEDLPMYGIEYNAFTYISTPQRPATRVSNHPVFQYLSSMLGGVIDETTISEYAGKQYLYVIDP